MAPLGVPQSHPGGAWLVYFNNSQRIRYMAPLRVPQSHPGGAWLVSFNNSQGRSPTLIPELRSGPTPHALN